MFVAVVCDVMNDDHRLEVEKILKLYGFTQRANQLFESTSVAEKSLARLKRDVDRATDSYDTVYFYQYPMQGTLVVSHLEKKRWRKRILQQEA